MRNLLAHCLLSVLQLTILLFVNFFDFFLVVFELFFELILDFLSFLLVLFLQLFFLSFYPILKLSFFPFFYLFFILSNLLLSFLLLLFLLLGHFFDIGFPLLFEFLWKTGFWFIFFGFVVFLYFFLFGFIFLFDCCFLIIKLFAFLLFKFFLLFFPLHFDQWINHRFGLSDRQRLSLCRNHSDRFEDTWLIGFHGYFWPGFLPLLDNQLSVVIITGMFEHYLTSSDIIVGNFSGLSFSLLPIWGKFGLKTLLSDPEEIFFLRKLDVNELSVCDDLFNFWFVLTIKILGLFTHLWRNLREFGFVADRGWLIGLLLSLLLSQVHKCFHVEIEYWSKRSIVFLYNYLKWI